MPTGRKVRVAMGLLLAAVACVSNPSIDGSTVPKIGSDTNPPSCADLCARLTRLCGYAPVECTTADAGGYCDVQFDSLHRVCVGQAGSCKDALDCVNEEAPDGAADDAAVDDAKGQ